MLTQEAFLIVGTRGREAENGVVDRRRVCMGSKTVLGDVVFVVRAELCWVGCMVSVFMEVHDFGLEGFLKCFNALSPHARTFQKKGIACFDNKNRRNC